jgi:hypothetical protein
MAKRHSSRRSQDGRIVLHCKQRLFVWCLLTAIFFGALFLLALVGLVAGARRPPLPMLGLFVVTAVMTAGAVAGCIYFGVKRPRLVLDATSLQLPHGTGAGQVPFHNIAATQVSDRVDEWNDQRKWFYLEITLRNRNDEYTWWPQVQRKKGYDIEIRDEFEKDLFWLQNRIRERLAAGHVPP